MKNNNSILILGGDGYLGWPTAMHLSSIGYDVKIIDNYYRRKISKATNSEALIEGPNLHIRTKRFYEITNKKITFEIGDCSDYEFINNSIKNFHPGTIIHFAEQPSAPYSMIGFREAKETLQNNVFSTFNLIWSIIENKLETHIIKLGTMGEYGTPNIDIEEGWIDINHNGRSHKFLYPRQASSLYHTTKVLDTDLLWFYVRVYGLRVTDLMQGPVYGIFTKESVLDDMFLPNFHYDDIFGTVLNRFIVQAVKGIPLTVYGKGGQTRGYLNLIDTLSCIELAVKNQPSSGEMNIFNQFTETFSVNELAYKVKEASESIGINCDIQNVDNPRKEMEDHYYNPKHTNLLNLGLKPTILSNDVLVNMIKKVSKFKKDIDKDIALPRISWK